MTLDWFSSHVRTPLEVEPEWSSRVERWYQLDAAAIGLSETFWRHRERLALRPSRLLLASPLASNFSDRQFVETAAAPSPAKFVHTLPNTRGAALLRVMEWTGEVICLQKDPVTLLTAISEGMQPGTWVAGIVQDGPNVTGHIFVCADNGGTFKIERHTGLEKSMVHDRDLLQWLAQPEGVFWFGDFSIARS